tara:strand:+ start:1766 stop:5071 length:3306 start_codon:yes stop_codon:yes gene_type:complete
MDINELQQQLDNNTLDIRNFNGPGSPMTSDQQKALDELIRRGDLKGPAGGIGQIAGQTRIGVQGLMEERQEADRLGGIATPFGTVMSERESFELVGDVMGSFAPYLMNQDEITKDITAGITDNQGNIQKFEQPTGKQQFKLDRMNKSVTRLADTLSRLPVIGGATRAGRLFVKTIAGLERASQGIGQIVRAEGKALATGDATQSLLRAGARTEVASLASGAAGAGAGSALYDVLTLKNQLAANVTLDLADATEDDINQMGFLGRMTTHATNAMKNSLIYGIAGTAAGNVMARGYKAGKKSLFGLNSDDAVATAEMAMKMGIPLTPTQAASGSGLSFLAKNYFKVFGVVPLTGAPGRDALLQNYRDFLFPAGATLGNKKAFATPGDTLQPSTTAAFIYGQSTLGAEAASKIAQNYKDNISLLRDNHRVLLDEAIALENPKVIPTTNMKKVLAEIKESSQGDINNVYKRYVEGDLAGNLTKAEKDILQQQSLVNLDTFNNVDYISLQDHALFKKIISEMGMNTKNANLAEQSINLRGALEADLSSLNGLQFTEELLQQGDFLTFVNKQKGATQADKILKAKKLLQQFQQSANTANDIYHKIMNPFEGAMGKQFEKDQILGAKLFTAGTDVAPQDIFDRMIKVAIRGTPTGGGAQPNVQSLKALKKIIGTDTAGPKGEYARLFMEKVATRNVFDAFVESFGASSRVLDEGLAAKEAKVKDILKEKYAGLYAKKFEDSSKMAVDKELFDYIQTGKISSDDAEEILKVLDNSEMEFNFSNLDLGTFDINKFKNNLGFGSEEGIQMAFELYGKEHANNILQYLNLLQKSIDVGVTDPSTFLLRRMAIGGSVAGAGVASGYLTDSPYMGIGTSIAILLGMRGYGRAIANPKITKELLNLYSDKEKKDLLDAQPRKFGVFRGEDTSNILGLIDPTQPLGKFMGPKRARNVSNILNYLTSPQNDPVYTADKVSLEDVNTYLDRIPEVENIPNPQVAIAQLPDEVIKRFYPEYAVYKGLPPEEKAAYLKMLQGASKAIQEKRQVNQELSQTPDAPAQPQQQQQEQSVEQPQAQSMNQSMATPGSKVNLAQNYNFLFPQDATGQAIAQKSVS